VDFVVEGKQRFEITRQRKYNQGLAFEFKMHGERQLLYASHFYPPMIVGPHRFYFKTPGNDSAAYVLYGPHGFFAIPSDKDCPGEDLSALVFTDVMTRGYKKLTKSNWMLFAIIGGVAILLIAGILIWKSMGAEKGGDAAPQVTTEQGGQVIPRK
jgi:hypothetical protein